MSPEYNLRDGGQPRYTSPGKNDVQEYQATRSLLQILDSGLLGTEARGPLSRGLSRESSVLPAGAEGRLPLLGLCLHRQRSLFARTAIPKTVAPALFPLAMGAHCEFPRRCPWHPPRAVSFG